MLLFTFH